MPIKPMFLTVAELEEKIKECEEQRARVLYRLNGEPPLCATPRCGFSSPDRGEFRFKSAHSSGKKRIFVFCLACAAVIREKHGIETAPYGKILEDDLKAFSEEIRSFKEQLKVRRKQEEVRAEKAKLLEESGDDFLVALGIKKEELPQEEIKKAELVAEAARVKGKTNAQKKRERRQEERARAAGNGADPEPAAAEPEMEGVPEGQTAH